MLDRIRLNPVKTVEDRINETLWIYRDVSMERVAEREYKGFTLTRFTGQIWDIVIICQKEGDYTDRYEPYISSEWYIEGECTIDTLLKTVEDAKARQGKRFSPSEEGSKEVNYDDIPF